MPYAEEKWEQYLVLELENRLEISNYFLILLLKQILCLLKTHAFHVP